MPGSITKLKNAGLCSETLNQVKFRREAASRAALLIPSSAKGRYPSTWGLLLPGIECLPVAFVGNSVGMLLACVANSLLPLHGQVTGWLDVLATILPS